MAILFQGIQDIIDSAVNIDINRSKLVAQTLSRSGRLSTASRNWANPYRITVTPRPVWEYNDVRAMLEVLYRNDRYVTSTISLGDYTPSQGTSYTPSFDGYIAGNVLTVTSLTSGTIRVGDIISGTGIAAGTQILGRISGWNANGIFQVSISQTAGSSGSPIAITGVATQAGNPNLAWVAEYRGDEDDTGNLIVDSYSSYAEIGSALVIQQKTGSTSTANEFIIRSNDFIRVSGDLYPYQASYSVSVPVAVTGVTGTIAGTDAVTTITGLSSVANLSVGQVLTKTGGSGAFGGVLDTGVTYIQSIDSSTQITIVSSSANTAGSITFNGDGKTTANHKVVIPLNRGYLGNGQAANSNLFVGGGAARFRVKVAALPTYKFINKDLIEFTGDFELIEEIL
jgi:hypothetical protein